MDKWLAQAKQKHREASIPFDEPQPECSLQNEEKKMGYSPVPNFDSDEDKLKDSMAEIEPATEDLPTLTKKRKVQVVKKERKKFVASWCEMSIFQGWLEKSTKTSKKDGSEFAFCKVCNMDILAHKSVLVNHSKSEKHKLNYQQISKNTKIDELYKDKITHGVAVKNAEMNLCSLLASNNLPFLILDTLTPLLKNIFPDSKIAQEIQVKRTKATAICKSLGDTFISSLCSKLKEPGSFFSIIMDETTDISIKKQCALTVIFFDNNKVKTRFFDLIEPQGSSAADLFGSLKQSVESKNIPLTNLVGFSSDTTNVMVGQHNSVFSHLKEELPFIACIRCSCHMAHLAASKACLKLPRHVEDLLRNIGSHFNRSALRRQKFEEFQKFFQVEIHKILSPAMIRWLSVKQVVDRVLEQYEPLKAYFTEVVFEDPSITTQTMLETMTNPFTKIYLEFMSYSIGLMTDFNILFQSEKPLLYRLKPETETLLKTLCSNFMIISKVRNAPDIFKFNHENPSDFSPIEEIYLGMSATDTISELKKSGSIEQREINFFYKAILSFYIVLVSNIKDRFKFEDPVFEIVEVLNPKIAQKFKIKSLARIIDRFPVLKEHVNIQQLDNEWRRHALLNFQELNLDINDSEQYWSEIFSLKNDASMSMFPNLKTVLALLLVLPYSNASVERIFSDLFNIKTDKRNLLNRSTTRAIIATKEGVKESGGCIKFQPTKEMLNYKIWQEKE